MNFLLRMRRFCQSHQLPLIASGLLSFNTVIGNGKRLADQTLAKVFIDRVKLPGAFTMPSIT